MKAENIDQKAQDSEKALAVIAKGFTAHPVKKISNAKAADAAVERRKGLKLVLDEIKAHIEQDKKEIIKPLRAVLDVIYKRHRDVQAPILAEDKALKQALETYETAQSQKRIKAAEKKAEERGLDPKFAAQQAVLKDSSTSAKTRNVWSYEVTDLAAVPAIVNGVEIRTLAHSKLLALIRSVDGNIQIPGLRIFVKKEVRR